ncbi:ankyrin repeat and zinc finger domain-containing protein 1 isoform X2 [Pseudoliparis swirei]|uniref:ankyrin repeat and zinc finger domain-containing protein 1 isoform X2 n=1 Tax=Pseudoliparis swirei TaxID=2059687 RepID=UPI0024BD6C2A|nr:ankyrin repeat and zinc finger domain-containing protein 1 isoform X2 [Pseudoliparis swirei]
MWLANEIHDMTTGVDYRSIFHLCPDDEALHGLRGVNSVQGPAVNTDPASDVLEDKSPEDDRQRESSLVREVSDKMVCSACRCAFVSREEQMEHYKLDWHRFNLRLKISGMPPVTAEEFERKTGAGDMSSISGSESDSEDDDSDSESGGKSSNVTGTDNNSSVENSLFTGRHYNKVFFQNSAGQYISVYRCILQGQSDEDRAVGSFLKALSQTTVWVVLMTGGGHFAGAVFRGKEVLLHKTFHRYTVRAKRGTAQGLKDSQNRSHTPKSAGATLRRHNEAALVKEIQDLLVSWAEHLKEASAIFVRAPSYNKSILFGGREAPFDKKDPRIHTIPFATRRATFREARRAHEMLSTVHVYGKDTDMSAVFAPSKKALKKSVKPAAQINTDQEKDENHDSSGEEEGGDIQLEMVEMTIGTLDLREFDIYPSRPRRRRRRKEEESKQQNEELSPTEADDQEEVLEARPAEDAPQETQARHKRKRKAQSKKQLEGVVDESSGYGLRDEVFTACKVGDVDALRGLLQPPGDTSQSPEQSQSNPSDAPSPPILLNHPIDSSGFTLLHVASAAAQKAVVRFLLDAGADPACRLTHCVFKCSEGQHFRMIICSNSIPTLKHYFYRDNKRQTPYVVCPDKDTRNVFRKYMGENPDKYDYIKAQIPGPLTAEIESKKMEKKRAQKALKKQREKEQKEEKRKQDSEAEEKKRFASLTDREKRALAAERRLAEQVADVKRCWFCGESLFGKIPFQYLEYSFCTPSCVQAHRKTHTLPGKT